MYYIDKKADHVRILYMRKQYNMEQIIYELIIESDQLKKHTLNVS